MASITNNTNDTTNTTPTTNNNNNNSNKLDVPTNANKTCVGTNSEQAGKVSSCDGCPNQSLCASGEARTKSQQINKEVNACIGDIKHKILVLSGKGGVGKSTFSAQMAFNLAKRGHRVGLLDIDICGPSIPLMLGLKNSEVHNSGDGWSPVYVTPDGNEQDVEDDLENNNNMEMDGGMVAVISVGFMLPDNDSAVIWRGPRKNALIKQFLTDVDWGELDYLIVDTPPGTSDEHISIVQYLKGCLQDGKDGCVVITTPQEASMGDVRKELNFCKKTHLNVLGIVENMSGFILPFASSSTTDNNLNKLNIINNDTGNDVTNDMMLKIKTHLPELLNCSVFTNIFTTTTTTTTGASVDTPKEMAKKFSVPYLGSLPLDTDYLKACESGKPVDDNTNASKRLNMVIDNMLSKLN